MQAGLKMLREYYRNIEWTRTGKPSRAPSSTSPSSTGLMSRRLHVTTGPHRDTLGQREPPPFQVNILDPSALDHARWARIRHVIPSSTPLAPNTKTAKRVQKPKRCLVVGGGRAELEEEAEVLVELAVHGAEVRVLAAEGLGFYCGLVEVSEAERMAVHDLLVLLYGAGVVQVVGDDG